MKTLTCTFCKTEFTRNKVDNRNPNYFCSKSCSASYHNLKQPKRKPEGTCTVCGQPCKAHRQTCSASCKTKAAIIKKMINPPQTSYEGVKSWRKRTKEKLVELKGGKCVLCGYSKCTSALEFHHIDPKEKDFTLSAKILAISKILPELEKCILVCSNCHREIHAGLVVVEGLEPSASILSGSRSNQLSYTTENLSA